MHARIHRWAIPGICLLGILSYSGGAVFDWPILNVVPALDLVLVAWIRGTLPLQSGSHRGRQEILVRMVALGLELWVWDT